MSWFNNSSTEKPSLRRRDLEPWYVGKSMLEYAKWYFINNEQKGYNTIALDSFKGKAKHEGPPGKICYLIKKHFTNMLGLMDSAYYYLVYREYWYAWATEQDDEPNKAYCPKYVGIPGFGLDSKIANHVELSKNIDHSQIVVAMPNPADKYIVDAYKKKLEFFYIPGKKWLQFVLNNNTKFEGRYGQTDWGAPHSIMTNIDQYR